jgi:hypothetical protein
MNMMITKNQIFASLTVGLALTLSACTHNAPKPEVTPEVSTTAAEQSFVDRAIATAPGESALILKVVQTLSGSDEALFLREAKTFLSTDERITASNVARKFTDEQGLAFLKDFKLRNAQVFRGAAMEEIAGRIDSAIAERAHAGNLEGHSGISTGMHLTDAPNLVTSVRRVTQISPELGQKVVHVYQLTKYAAADSVTCTTVARFSNASLSNTIKLYNGISTAADRMPAGIHDKKAWMTCTAAGEVVNFASATAHSVTPFQTGANLSNHCHLPPNVAQEIGRLEGEYARTGQMPNADSCRNY